jgi:hypothetical protein
MDKFYCYSPKLKKELKELGYKWIDTGKHHTTNKIYWVYEIVPELKQYLIDRRDRKI